jgi:uncharacterized membrane protein HdeD (DUF308 family)
MENERKTNKMAYVFGLFMIAFYIIMAGIFVFSSIFEQNFSPVVRYCIGILFLLYGIFRCWRVVRFKH